MESNVYHKAKLWQMICYGCNGLLCMSVYSLIGMASYSASIGFGIATAVVGVILTATRILDGITDPLLAFVYDRVNTKFGKIRPLLVGGFVIEFAALLAMFSWLPGRFEGAAATAIFVLCYCIYVIGYTMVNITAQTIPMLLTNDPAQRPVIGVWNTAFNYIVPMALSMTFYTVILPRCGGTFNLQFLSTIAYLTLAVAFVGLVCVCASASAIDKPENFEGIKAGKTEKVSLKEMIAVLKDNKPLQCYIVSAASDKIASQTKSQAVINTMLMGIIIGNMGLSTTLSMIGMFPSILFAIVGARYAGKHGSKEAIVTWTEISIAASAAMWIFMIIIDPTKIAVMGSPMMIIYVILTFCMNGAMMCVTTAGTSFMADITDYELDRSGNYIPAVVTGVYSFIDKLVSSFGALIATTAIGIIGYTTTVPQPGDPSTPGVFWVCTCIVYGLPILGWLCTLLAMKVCKLDRHEMVEVQQRIAEKKAELKK